MKMEKPSAVPPELAAALRRYLAIQAEEQKLRDEKTRLQETLGRHLTERRLACWYPDIDGQRLKVRYSAHTVVEYNEAVLRERLGERYASILAPDIRKIRRCLPEIAPLLTPVMDKVGAPAADRVRAAVEQGLVRKEEFAGAFQKTTRRLVAVSRARPADLAAETDGEDHV